MLLSGAIATVPGLLWKVWMVNDHGREAGGIYLFSDGPAMDAFLNSEILCAIISQPALSDFSVKQFDVLQGMTAVNRGPID